MAREKVDDEVIIIVAQTEALCQAAVTATVEIPDLMRRAVQALNALRAGVYEALMMMPPLSQRDTWEDDIAPTEATIAEWKKMVAKLAPEIPWAPSPDDQGLALGAEAATTRAALPQDNDDEDDDDDEDNDDDDDEDNRGVGDTQNSRETPAATLKRAVGKVAEAKGWDETTSERLSKRAEYLFRLHISPGVAAAVAGQDVARETEMETRLHRPSPPKQTAYIPPHKTAEDVQKEALARSRIGERRPAQKFSEGKSLQYMAQKRHFLRATNMEGFTAEDKFAEFAFWFEGIALLLVGRQTTGDSAERAIEKAWAELDEYFCAKQLTPKESLQDLLDEGPIDKKDAKAHTIVALTLQREIDEAEATGCAAAYDEPSVINEVLHTKVEYLAEEFWGMIARSDETPTFRRLIEEIKLRAKILRRMRGYRSNGGNKHGTAPPLMGRDLSASQAHLSLTPPQAPGVCLPSSPTNSYDGNTALCIGITIYSL